MGNKLFNDDFKKKYNLLPEDEESILKIHHSTLANKVEELNKDFGSKLETANKSLLDLQSKEKTYLGEIELLKKNNSLMETQLKILNGSSNNQSPKPIEHTKEQIEALKIFGLDPTKIEIKKPK